MAASSHLRSARGRIWLALLALVVLVLVPVAGDAKTITAGTADASSAIITLTTGLGSLSIATDDAQARIGSSPRAYARFISGSTTDQQVGAAERTASKPGEKQTATLGDGPFSIGDVLSLGNAGANITTEISNGARSDVTAQLGDVSLFGGWLQLDGASSITQAHSTSTGSTVHREIHLDGMRALETGDLLAALDVNPLELTCAAIAAVGSDLGHDASACQSKLDDVTATISDAVDALQAAVADVTAERDTVSAAIAAAEAQLASLQSQRSSLETQLAALQDDLASLAAQRTDLQGQLSAAEATLAGLQASNDSLTAQIQQLQDATSGYTESALQADRTTVTSCDGLAGVPATACQATLLLNSFPSLASTYGVDLGGLGFTGARAALLSSIDTLLADFTALDAATAELATLGGQLSTVNADIASLDSQIDDLTSQIDALDAQIAAAQSDLDDATSLIATVTQQLDDLNAQLDALTNDLAVIDASDPAATTCTLTSSALGSVGDLVPSLSSTLSPLKTQLDDACAALASTVNGLLGVPLITIDGIDITLDIDARADHPSVSVSGTLGSVQVGENAPVIIDLPTGSDELPLAQALISSTLVSVVSDTGLGLPLPELKVLATDRSTGRRADGTWYAHGSVTFLKLTLPAGDVTVPSSAPLGALDGTAGFGGTSAGPAHMMRAAATSPVIDLGVGVFNADGAYNPANGGGGGGSNDPSLDEVRGKRLPTTGVGFGLWPALLMIAAGACLCRTLRRA
ncbi:MAG: hypothetical protein ABR552_06215 [Actinomycetota bacterium]